MLRKIGVPTDVLKNKEDSVEFYDLSFNYVHII